MENKKIITKDNLQYYHQNIAEKINSKQDKISDLETIRNNANLGASALQNIPSEYITETELNNKGYAKQTDLSSKQETLVSGVNIKYINGSSILGNGDLTIATGENNVQANWNETNTSSDAYIQNKPSIPTNATVESWGFTKNTGTIEAIDTTETIDGVSNDFVTSEQLDARNYATENFVTEKIAEASIGGGSGANMENYYTKSEIDNKGYLTSVPSEYVTETELTNKGYATTTQVNSKQDKISDLNTIRSGAALGATALQSVPSEYVTETELANKDYATQTNLTTLANRVTKVENMTSLDMRASVLWLGTSIPSGDINIDPQQLNTYPKMVADALGFDLYNMAKAGSMVSWYPQTPSWTTSAQVAAEFATAYCLSATRQEIYNKYYNVLETIRQNEGLSTTWRDDYLNDFMDSSFETRIIPYIDGTIAKCDGVVIDHGFNDRGNIFNVCNQHVTADKDSISVWGPDSGADGVEYPVIGGNAGWYWLTHLADNRYYDGEVYMNTVYAVANGLAGNDTGGMRGEYFGAMSYIIAKIQQVDPRIRIVIGNYFSQDYGVALGDGMNSFQTKYILQANQSIADYYGFPCVNVYKHTGLRNRTIRKPDGTTISDMYWFCPDGVHPSSDTTGLSNSIIASAYVSQIKGCFFKLD